MTSGPVLPLPWALIGVRRGNGRLVSRCLGILTFLIRVAKFPVLRSRELA